ncbi:hypothetical protein SAMN04489713_11475 [Actinomadura madurae]|uniref:Uncharacterized protein n=1 Tax=Actinomadura madurae TaxID=1993 RepID=A0A1I5QD72_9ACTN|nr:hypothetical protein SAMN04489713_11475 [Actinomadura madurae]
MRGCCGEGDRSFDGVRFLGGLSSNDPRLFGNTS